MQKVTPFLWFNGGVEEAAKLYASVFSNTKILSSNPMSATVDIDGQVLILFNGGPHYKQTPAFSLSVNCETQQEIDEKWDALIADGGAPSRCGWLVDKFGVSWQIVPSILGSLLGSTDRQKADRAMQAMLKMEKMDIAALQSAYEGK